MNDGLYNVSIHRKIRPKVINLCIHTFSSDIFVLNEWTNAHVKTHSFLKPFESNQLNHALMSK